MSHTHYVVDWNINKYQKNFVRYWSYRIYCDSPRIIQVCVGVIIGHPVVLQPWHVTLLASYHMYLWVIWKHDNYSPPITPSHPLLLQHYNITPWFITPITTGIRLLRTHYPGWELQILFLLKNSWRNYGEFTKGGKLLDFHAKSVLRNSFGKASARNSYIPISSQEKTKLNWKSNKNQLVCLPQSHLF